MHTSTPPLSFFLRQFGAGLLVLICTCQYERVSAQSCMADATNGLARSSFFASGENVGAEYEKAFNNENGAASKWAYTSAGFSVGTPAWIGTNFGGIGPKTLTGYLISAAADMAGRDPGSWIFQGSNDGLDWTDLDQRTNQTFVYRGQSRIFSFNNTVAYTQYRLLILETADIAETTIHIGELEFYEKVCLEGFVTEAGIPLANVTVGMLGEAYSVGGGGGSLLATAVTDASGKYIFNTSDVPDGQFSIIVEPPAGYQIVSNTLPFFTDPAWADPFNRFSVSQFWYSYDGAIIFENHHQLAQSLATTGGEHWDSEESTTYTNRFTVGIDKSNLNFDLKKSAPLHSCLTLNGSPLSAANLITVAENGTFGSFAAGVGSGSYLRVHPSQPGFSKDFENLVLYDNEGYLTAARTQYVYVTRPNTLDVSSGPGSGVMLGEGTFTVTSYIGTLADLIDGNNAGLNATSLLNIYAKGWRKTYGSTTGDVFDKFLILNGASNNLPLFTQPGLELNANTPYLFSFDGKNANAFSQGINQIVEVPYFLLDDADQVVTSGVLTLASSASLAEDDPHSEWQKVFATILAPTTGAYKLQIRYPGGSAGGNDFYLDNISLRAMTDFGDNPVSYGEAVHNQSVFEINENCDPQLKLGALIDIKMANQPTSVADGDNASDLDDEDAVIFPILNEGASSYTVSVEVNNLTTSDAFLYAWIDWDLSGTFEVGERVNVTIPPNTINGTFPLTWNGLNVTGSPYARFRLSSEGSAASLPTGIAPNGEVEDYLITMTPLPVTLTQFTVGKEGSKARLQWTTTSETGASYFEIQRSGDAKRWFSLGAVSAVGESSGAVMYQFTDTLLTIGVVYYRLKMMDLDGSYSLSTIRSLQMGDIGQLSLYPNPAKERVYLNSLAIGSIKEITFLRNDGHSIRSVKWVREPMSQD